MIIYQNHKHVVKIIFFFLKIECGISIKVLHNSGNLDGKYRSTLVLHILVYNTFSDDRTWKVFSILKCYEVYKNIRMFLSISNCFALMKNEFHIFFCIPKKSHGITPWEETRRFKVASWCTLTEWNATYHVFIYYLFMFCLPCLEQQNFSSTLKFMWEKSWTISRLGNF